MGLNLNWAATAASSTERDNIAVSIFFTIVLSLGSFLNCNIKQISYQTRDLSVTSLSIANVFVFVFVFFSSQSKFIYYCCRCCARAKPQ